MKFFAGLLLVCFVQGAPVPFVDINEKIDATHPPCHEYSHLVESPCFEVVRQADGYQVRRYSGHDYWAAVDVAENEWNPAIKKGFEALYQYITGHNQDNKYLSMKVPVISTRSFQGVTLAFFVSRNTTVPPNPLPDSQVQIFHATEEWFAVSEFGGYASEAEFQQQISELNQRLLRDKVIVAGDDVPRLAQFDSPWHFWPRHNQVMVKLPPPDEGIGAASPAAPAPPAAVGA